MAQSAGTVGKHRRPRLSPVSEEPSHKKKKKKIKVLEPEEGTEAGGRIKLRDEKAIGAVVN